MQTFIEILKIILPTCITGLVTFLVTKYNYHKNIPLDKMEIAYNRLYYPLYCLIRDDKDVALVIAKSEFYLKKYNKYVDRSTLVAFRFLKSNHEQKKAYSNYKDNIYKLNGKLRRRLGYLEPNIFSMYTYAAPYEKRMFRLVFESLGTYLAVIVFSNTDLEFLQVTAGAIFGIASLALTIEIIVIICLFVVKGTKRIYQNIKDYWKCKD